MKLRLLLLLSLASATSATDQTITYNSFSFSGGQPVATLRDMAANGTGDRAIATGLTEPGFPAWSRDGRQLALTSPDPLRPSKLSRDIFILDGPSGVVRKMHTFNDTADANGFSKYLPIAKAFSPDGRRLAASVFLHAGVRQGAASGISTLPMLYLFDTSGTEPPVIIASAALQDEVTLGGHGIDWSPNGSLLAWPSTVNSGYYVNGVLSGGVTSTGIYLGQPSVNIQARQLTFPVTRTQSTLSLTRMVGEVDYAPAFSPNSAQVAYVRVVRTKEYPLRFPPDQGSIRMINADGSGDRELLALTAGLWISQIAWSPDGTRLLFDMGPQQTLNGIPIGLPVAQSVEIHSLNPSTRAASRLRSAPAAWPAWRPTATTTTGSVQPPSIRLVPGNVELSWPASETAQLESSPTLQTWNDVTAAPIVSGGMKRISLPRTAAKMFFRLRSL